MNAEGSANSPRRRWKASVHAAGRAIATCVTPPLVNVTGELRRGRRPHCTTAGTQRVSPAVASSSGAGLAYHHEHREATDAVRPGRVEPAFGSQIAVRTPSLLWSHVQAPLTTTARSCPLGCRVAREPRTRGVPSASPIRHGGPPDQPVRAPTQESGRGVPVRGLRGRAVPRRGPVRLRDGLAQLHHPGDPGRRRHPHRLQDAGATARGHMHPLRRAPGTRVRRRSCTRRPTMVHQRRRSHSRRVWVSTRGGAARLT